ncbi:alpha/beta fold hydrolase [Parafilimonas sp.]|uniref:alpha/beta fold hydrolase n=1 Tax=Parafilimonas sp. TaxID=1969739 RepID=UPI0039E4D61D
MPYFKSKTGTETLQLFYEDLGNDNPIVFIGGWPLTHQMWEYQLTPLRELGYRCIVYDRRGFGKSDQSLNSYDYDTLAEDLKNLLDELDVNNATLVGFSMGGGEVVRYCSKHACERVSRIILVSSVVPYMLETGDNPDGVPLETFREFDQEIRKDRPGFLANFAKQFYGIGFFSHPVSAGIVEWTNSLAFTASQKAMLSCAESFSQTDFRNELSAITVPALIIHGDEDKTVPIKATGEVAAKLIKGALYKVYPGAPHGLFFTHKNILNRDIISFISAGVVDENDILEEGYEILPGNEPLIIRDGEQE